MRPELADIIPENNRAMSDIAKINKAQIANEITPLPWNF